MTQFEILQKFFRGQCGELEDELENCQLLYNQFKKDLHGICKCMHGAMRVIWRPVVLKNLTQEQP